MCLSLPHTCPTCQRRIRPPGDSTVVKDPVVKANVAARRTSPRIDHTDIRLYTHTPLEDFCSTPPPIPPHVELDFMNTYRIYEDLRASLGEEAAKSLAHTLGPMFEELGETVTKAEFRDLSTTVGRLAEAQGRTEEKVAQLVEGQAGLAAAQARTEAQVAKLADAQARTEARVSELTQAQTQIAAQVADLTHAQTRTENQLAALTLVVQSLAEQGSRQATRLDTVLGRTFEMHATD